MLVYPAPIDNEETLHQHNFYACQAICSHPRYLWNGAAGHDL